MAGFVDALEASILNLVMRNVAYSPPANWFVGLSTTTPTDAGGNFTEPVGNGYARVSTAIPGDWSVPAGTAPTQVSNANPVTFAQASGAWGLCTYFGLFTALSGGTPQIIGALLVTKSPAAGDTPSFAVAVLIVELGDPGDTY